MKWTEWWGHISRQMKKISSKLDAGTEHRACSPFTAAQWHHEKVVSLPAPIDKARCCHGAAGNATVDPSKWRVFGGGGHRQVNKNAVCRVFARRLQSQSRPRFGATDHDGRAPPPQRSWGTGVFAEWTEYPNVVSGSHVSWQQPHSPIEKRGRQKWEGDSCEATNRCSKSGFKDTNEWTKRRHAGKGGLN